MSALGSGRACPATVIAFCPSCQRVARPLSVRRTGVHPSTLPPLATSAVWALLGWGGGLFLSMTLIAHGGWLPNPPPPQPPPPPASMRGAEGTSKKHQVLSPVALPCPRGPTSPPRRPVLAQCTRGSGAPRVGPEEEDGHRTGDVQGRGHLVQQLNLLLHRQLNLEEQAVDDLADGGVGGELRAPALLLRWAVGRGGVGGGGQGTGRRGGHCRARRPCRHKGCPGSPS